MKNYFMMAFAAGQESKAATESFAKYTGVASAQIAAINPTMAELNTLYNTDKFTTEPVYHGVYKNSEGRSIEYGVLNVVFKINPEDNNGVDTLVQQRFMISNESRLNTAKDKIQVIDQYGRTAWVTKEELTNHVIPVYSSGTQANIAKEYRPLYKGEEAITNLFKCFLNIPEAANWIDGKWKPRTDLKGCEARFDTLKELIMKGDVTEFKTAWQSQPNNKVKILLGVKNYNGKEIQVVYDRMFLRNGVKNYGKLQNDVTASNQKDVIYIVGDIQEYKVEPTPVSSMINTASDSANPFGDPKSNPFF